MSNPENLHSDLLVTLKARFEANPNRHQGIQWADVEARLRQRPDKLVSLQRMEETGGEPDVVGQDGQTGEFIFFDCALVSPTGRRSLCYDQAAKEARKEHKPVSSAVEMAVSMGIELLTEDQYRELQTHQEFDLKTSSWIATPPEVRRLGGAIFADCRYGRVFVYHNGADSYYASRGFRGSLRV